MGSLESYLEARLISLLEDQEIIRRAMNHTFAAHANQNLGFSTRVGQKLEQRVIEDAFREKMETIQGKIQPQDISNIKI